MGVQEKYYATLITPEGKEIDLSSNIRYDYELHLDKSNIKGKVISNAVVVFCRMNQITSLDLPNAEKVNCVCNEITSLNLPNAIKVNCSSNPIKSLKLPKARFVSFTETSLNAIVTDCGEFKRTIWSQKVGDNIYTYIGCGCFTLEKAIEAINEKYSGKEAEDYINKVKQSQSLAE